MHGGIVSDQVIHIFSYSATAISLVANGLLIYSLLVIKLHHVGAYRWLLMSFALFDICISLAHAITLPAIHMTECGFIMWPIRFLNDPTGVGVWSLLLWTFLFFQTFILLAYHYVYRFILLCNPTRLSRIRRRPWLLCGSIAVAIGGIFVTIMRTSYLPTEAARLAFAKDMREAYCIDLFAENRPGFIVVAFWLPTESGEREWQMGTILASTINFAFLLVTVAVIAFCFTRILHASRTDKAHLASKTQRLQRQLFQALVWQTVIPAVTSYIPVSLIVLLPLALDFPMGGMGTVALLSAELFPVIDPFLIFIFVPRYRAVLPRLCRKSTRISIKISIVKSTDSTHYARGAITRTAL